MNREKKGLFQNLDFLQFAIVVYMVGFGLHVAIRGAYWVVRPLESAKDSALFETMHDYGGLTFWGLLILIGATFQILSSIILPYYRQTNVFFFTYALGNFICGAFYFLYSVASVNSGLSPISPFQNLAFAVMMFILSIAGGMHAWNTRKSQT